MAQLSTLIPLRSVLMDRVILAGEPYIPADEREQKKLLEKPAHWRKATKADLDAWKTRLSKDPLLAQKYEAIDPVTETEFPEHPKDTKKRKDAEAKAKAEAEEKAAAEAEAKAKEEAAQKLADEVRASAAGKAEGDSQPGPSGGTRGPGGIG